MGVYLKKGVFMTINDIKHPKIKAWVEEVAKMCQPDDVYVCDGSKEEYDRLMQDMIKSGLATPLKKLSLVASMSFFASAEIFPQAKVFALSP